MSSVAKILIMSLKDAKKVVLFDKKCNQYVSFIIINMLIVLINPQSHGLEASALDFQAQFEKNVTLLLQA